MDEVLINHEGGPDGFSDTTGNPMVCGWTSSGKHVVIYRDESDDELVILRPVTAYPVPDVRGVGLMDGPRISDRTRRQLDKLPPEKRAKALEVIARTQTPEYRAREAANRESLDREYRETGRIAASPQRVSDGDMEQFREFLASLRRAREAMGLSLNDVAARAGIDKAAISRLETGQHPNPTVSTLARYAGALGKRISLTLEEIATGNS